MERLSGNSLFSFGRRGAGALLAGRSPVLERRDLDAAGQVFEGFEADQEAPGGK